MNALEGLGAPALAAIRANPIRAQYLVQSTLSLACAFGLHLTVVQIAAIASVSAAILGEIARTQVVPLSAAAAPGQPGATP